MVSIINEINKGLHESTGLFALAELPNDTFTLPLLVVTERSNELNNVALDGRVEVAQLTYEITIYSNEPLDIYHYQEIIDSYLNQNIKRFTSSVGKIEQDYPVYHRTLSVQMTVQRVGNNYYIL